MIDYQQIDGYFDWEPLYDYIAARLPDGGTFVEVGCWRGKSLAYMLTRLLLRHPKKIVKVHGVDHFAGSKEEPRLAAIAAKEDIEAQCRHNLSSVGYPFSLWTMPSVFAARRFADASVDCVFLDGSHDFDSVAADLRAWMPKLKRDGLLAGHDLNQIGVAAALHEVLGDVDAILRLHLEDERFPDGYKWGVAWSIEAADLSPLAAAS